MQILEPVRRKHGDLVFVLKRSSNLVHDDRLGSGVPVDVEEEPGQGAGRGLAARHDEQRGQGHDLDGGEARTAVALGLQHVRHEVAAALGLHAELHARHGLVLCQCPVAVALPSLLAAQAAYEQGLQEGVVSAGAQKGVGLDALEDVVDPRVVLARLETAKGLPKRQVANDVKGGEVEPFDNVERPVLCRVLGHALHEQLDVLVNGGLLLAHRDLTKGVAQLLALAAMDIPRCGNDAVLDASGKDARSFLELGLSGQPAAVDLRPGYATVHGKTVWTYTDNGAIATVEIGYLPNSSARDVGSICKWQIRDGP